MDKIAVIDFETTGIQDSEVLQTAIIDENETPLLYELSRPEKVVRWPGAQAVHGIGPEAVRDKWPFRFLVPQVERLLNAADIVLAYNARFELGLLASYGVKLRHTEFIDPMLMFAPVYGEWNDYHGNYRWQKLETAAAYYGYKFDAHDALADVKATLYVYRRMLADGVEVVRVPTGAVAA